MSLHPRLALCVVAAATLHWANPAAAVKCPNIMLVLDQSGSMSETPAGTTPKNGEKSKWQLLQDAIVAVVDKYGDQVPIGLELYSTFGTDQECYARTKIDVEPAHDSAKQIIARIKAAKPDSGTNTGEAVKRAAASKVMQDPARGQFIILVTDGDPNCSSGDDDGNATYTTQQIALAAKAATPIKTYVIGFDGTSGVNPDNLNKMAKAGGVPIEACTGRVGSRCYYSASDAKKLIDSLNKVVNAVVGGGEFGMSMCDDSCYASGCPDGYVCLTDEFNLKPTCVPNPCAGIEQCAPGDYCRGGQCVPACAQPCRANERCVDGTCVLDPCHGVECGDGSLCDSGSGGCVANQCLTSKCKGLAVCEPVSGRCVDDQCRIITCPAGTACKPGGNCEALAGPDGGTPTSGRKAAARGCGGAIVAGRVEPGAPLEAGLALTLLCLGGVALAFRPGRLARLGRRAQVGRRARRG